MATDYEASDTGNWNVNKEYAQIEIMRHITEASILEERANFGTQNIYEDLVLQKNEKNINKIIALRRLHKKIETIIRRTKFGLKNANDKKLFDEYLKILNVLQPLIIKSEKKIQKIKGVEIGINEKYFSFVLLNLENLFTKLLEPLNRADMIFQGSENVDASELKEIIKNRLMTQA